MDKDNELTTYMTVERESDNLHINLTFIYNLNTVITGIIYEKLNAVESRIPTVFIYHYNSQVAIESVRRKPLLFMSVTQGYCEKREKRGQARKITGREREREREKESEKKCNQGIVTYIYSCMVL